MRLEKGPLDLAFWPSSLTLTGTELAERWARSQLEWFEKTSKEAIIDSSFK